jgi:hypothetical protein
VNAYVHYAQWEGCSVHQVPGTFKAATVAATGVSWAFGKFAPQSGCTVIAGNQTYDANRAYPFGVQTGDTGIFEKQPRGVWEMNSFETDPFPCPADISDAGRTPGPGNPYVPLAVLDAVGLHWVTGCDHATTAPLPR